MKTEIRKLKAEEIECRVAQCGKGKKGPWCSILLYKDVRVDQRILDETFGMLNWKRSHELIGDRLYCTVSVWDEGKQQWISKQDVGTESYTEKEKGQASDAFKRACFNLGIGRELYTAPKIFISLNDGEYTERDGKIYPKISLDVSSIDYDEEGRISALTLIDSSLTMRYRLGNAAPSDNDGWQQPEKFPRPQKESPAKKRLVRGSGAWVKAVERIARGEEGLMEKLRSSYVWDEQTEADFSEDVFNYNLESRDNDGQFKGE